MKTRKDMLVFAAILIILSIVLYLLDFYITKDANHILIFVADDLGFIPIEILATVVIFNSVLERRDRKNKIQKINLLVEVFFEEVGNELLQKLASKDKRSSEIASVIPKDGGFSNLHYKEITDVIGSHISEIKLTAEEIDDIYNILKENRNFIIKFLENPYLMEHDRLTDLLQAVSHFYHEISFRKKEAVFSEEAIEHLCIDAERVYKFLSEEWILYMKYIYIEYPFLFSLAIRNLPFQGKDE